MEEFEGLREVMDEHYAAEDARHEEVTKALKERKQEVQKMAQAADLKIADAAQEDLFKMLDEGGDEKAGKAPVRTYTNACACVNTHPHIHIYARAPKTHARTRKRRLAHRLRRARRKPKRSPNPPRAKTSKPRRQRA
jgi:hypothetical protein